MTKEERNIVERFLSYVSNVISYHECGCSIPKAVLDNLANSQIDFEAWLKTVCKTKKEKT